MSKGASETLRPGEVRHPLAQLEQHRHRDCVAAGALELVDVERERRARARRRLEVIEQRALVELEVRRPDHRDGVDARLSRMRREHDRVGGRLGAAVCSDLQAAPRGGQEELDRPLSLLDAEQEPFAGRPEREQAVEPARREKVDVRAERRLVEPVAVERRHRRRKSSAQHAATLLGRG